MAYVETTSGASLSVSQVLSATADSTNIFDVTGAGSGNAPAMIGAGGLNTALGTDIGSGDGVATAQVFIPVITNGTGSGTYTITLSAAPDNGSYSPGSYTTLYTSAAIVGTTFKSGQILVIPVPPILPTEALPRFYKLTYTLSGTAGVTLSAYITFNAPIPREVQLFGNNFISV